ncbi:MAG: rRNA (guanine966-N2)-methyltransferase [Chloroflexota bacterium]|jgi:16S rRNA (guanine966-N2)-methyltransferase|nr:rRNA (guanine966-N2)-methyltransferase [Chloroflexota bacterium]
MADAGRVIAGSARGRRLVAPGEGTRPLADRVKQTLFAVLEPDLPGSAFLDLCAGSGAAGIEALSRGAARATFVERDRRVIGTIAENLTRTGLAGERASVIRAEAAAWLAGPAAGATHASGSVSAALRAAESQPGGGRGPFELVFIDPPYADADLLGRLLSILGADRDGRLLVPGARVVAKHFWRDRPPPAVGLLASERDRRFGETGLTFYRREGG